MENQPEEAVITVNNNRRNIIIGSVIVLILLFITIFLIFNNRAVNKGEAEAELTEAINSMLFEDSIEIEGTVNEILEHQEDGVLVSLTTNILPLPIELGSEKLPEVTDIQVFVSKDVATQTVQVGDWVNITLDRSVYENTEGQFSATSCSVREEEKISIMGTVGYVSDTAFTLNTREVEPDEVARVKAELQTGNFDSEVIYSESIYTIVINQNTLIIGSEEKGLADLVSGAEVVITPADIKNPHPTELIAAEIFIK